MISPDTSPLGTGIAVGLSSSFFGFYTHAGFMAELHRQGVFPDEIAGTSSGSIAAVICGLGYVGDQVEQFVLHPGMRTCFWDWLAPLRLPGIITCSYSTGMLSGKNAIKYLRQRFEGAKLEDFKKPKIKIAVTNLSRRLGYTVSEGDAASWVMASCAIPGLFCNQIIQGHRYCDGGVAINVPFDHWLKSPDIHTIILHQMDHEPGTDFTPKWPTVITSIAASHETICNVTLDLRLQLAHHHGKRLIVMNTVAPHPGIFPCTQRLRMIDAGKNSARRCVELLNSAIPSIQ